MQHLPLDDRQRDDRWTMVNVGPLSDLHCNVFARERIHNDELFIELALNVKAATLRAASASCNALMELLKKYRGGLEGLAILADVDPILV